MFVEADFLREYGINLARELPSMSWRLFINLVRGLSTQSATITSIQSRQSFGKKGERIHVVDGPKAAQSAFESIFGPPPPKT